MTQTPWVMPASVRMEKRGPGQDPLAKQPQSAIEWESGWEGDRRIRRWHPNISVKEI